MFEPDSASWPPADSDPAGVSDLFGFRPDGEVLGDETAGAWVLRAVL
jgi:hypothetical protein